MSSEPEPPATLADQAVFRPVRSGNAFEEAVERILQAIKLGVVGPGERLPAERDLAVRLGVSRMTLREAIRALQQSGYVESRRGRFGGTFVVNRAEDAPRGKARLRKLVVGMGSVGLEDTLTFREVLETGAAGAAATRPLPEPERALLRAVHEQVRTATPETYRHLDSRFHLAIAQITGSPSLASAVADNRMRINELLDAIPLLGHNIEHSHEQHERIVAAVLAGDGPAARAAMAEHLAGTAALLRAFLS
ncbi:FadR/GntR family transcriptional regulator [Crossiella cryophila]|uniref:DNA-binding FadR family transcriptional regulator n=1 Tax=Crossiella cryophila TaxID=43355 RepID=A0A7W7CDL6_9PSEU|nr:FCD domain-containing protein [Crossiella cryophila]MBB4679242.1 DNA-binding FadR family transcriptional regulator [Crossiella cryophila]